MKNVILAVGALVALSGAAIAADMPMKAAPVAAAGCAQFGGFYIGVNAGGRATPPIGTTTTDTSPIMPAIPPKERLERRRAGRLQLAAPLHGVRRRGRLELGLGETTFQDDPNNPGFLQRSTASCARSARPAPAAASSSMT